ncbi:phosphotransferase [Aeromicrobium sp. Leaf350]|uniref:phosphotransferase n=1 Tax=Aeromicrobium sp. Leaf350 TaxID=2876565 RepID=UPI001E60FEF0|nr:phosphotransferase [Aeromicrobium sp. Leaf350]
MDRAFSVEVAQAPWRREVEAWIAEHLPGATIESVEQPRIRPWSTQLRIETSRGRHWFKALPPGAAYEAGLHALLADLAPDDVSKPLAVDAARGWILDVDHGPTWHEQRTATTADWQALMAGIARLQQRLARHGTAILATGLPDCRPTRTVDLFDRFVMLFAELDVDHPCHLDQGVAAELREQRPRVAAAAGRLLDSALPSTFQHGDVHTNNVFATPEGLRLFDFGDAQWAHALEVLAVPRGVIDADEGDVAWEPVLAAYAAEWDLTPDDLVDDLAATWTTQSVHRCLTWWRALSSASASEWADWGDAPVHHLTRVLAHD